MAKFFSKKVLIFVGIILILVLGAVFSFKNGNGKQLAMAVQTDIAAEVAVTGKVKPGQSVDLGFDRSGKIGGVYAQVGDLVKADQVIAELESSEIKADLAKAKASLRAEDIALREIKSTAPISYNDAYKNLEAEIREGFANADNAVRNKADQFFKNIPNNPRFEISITSGNLVHYFNAPTDLVLEINNERKAAEEILQNWQTRISTLSQNNSFSEADKAISDLRALLNFFDGMAEAVNTFTSSDYAYDTTVSNYKTTISGARGDITSTIAAIVTAKDKINASPIQNMDGEFESVLIQKAAVSQAAAAVAALEASLNKSVIRAPFDGIITLQEAKVGAAVSMSGTLVSIISQENSYIEANISEIHIGKIALGNLVTVTFDAFPEEKFAGRVSYIEPGDVIIDGVVNYKIRVVLDNPNPKIKNGLTANLMIQTAKRGHVLALPIYAIVKENGNDFVNKVVGRKTQKVLVRLGLVGSDGLVEIISGLSAGDRVEF